MPKVELKINGKKLDLSPVLPVSASKLVAFLAKAPVDELYDTEEIAKKLGLGLSTIQSLTTRRKVEALTPFTHSFRKPMGPMVRYWGSAAAIAELKRQTA